jgi:hypothetical protein
VQKPPAFIEAAWKLEIYAKSYLAQLYFFTNFYKKMSIEKDRLNLPFLVL